MSYRLSWARQQDAGNRRAPCSSPARCSAAAMVAVPTAWCSIALALLMALHEGEPSGLACCSSPLVCSAVSPPGGPRCPTSQLGS